MLKNKNLLMIIAMLILGAGQMEAARPAARSAAQGNVSLEEKLQSLLDELKADVIAGKVTSEDEGEGRLRAFLVQNIKRGNRNALVGPSYNNAVRLAEWAINQGLTSTAQVIIDFIADTDAPGGVAAQQKSSAINLQAKLNAQRELLEAASRAQYEEYVRGLSGSEGEELDEEVEEESDEDVEVDELAKKFWSELTAYITPHLEESIDTGEDLSGDEVREHINLFTNKFLQANFKRGANNALLGTDNIRVVRFGEALINEAKRSETSEFDFTAVERVIAFIGEGTGDGRAAQQGLQAQLNAARAEVAERTVLPAAGEDEEYEIEEEVKEGSAGEYERWLAEPDDDGPVSVEELEELRRLMFP